MEHSKKLGTFYGVGVGPGDPELLTLKAVRVLEACPVLAAPQTASGEMTALSIARQAADLEGKTLLPLYFTMSRDRAKQQEAHINAVDERKQMLRMRAGWLSNQIMFFVLLALDLVLALLKAPAWVILILFVLWISQYIIGVVIYHHLEKRM